MVTKTPKRWILGVVVGILPTALTIGACGSRTGLDFPVEVAREAGLSDGGATGPTPDASPLPVDSGPPVLSDVARLADALLDVVDDDGPPPIRGIDASVPPDSATVCPDGGDATAYLVAESGAFYTFDPPTLAIHLLGMLNCPATASASPFTMTVSLGAAYVLYSDGTLFRVDLQSLACTPTPFVTGQLGFPALLGLATSRSSGAKGLLLYGCIFSGGLCAPTLARSDLTNFVLTEVGTLVPNPNAGFPVDMKEDAFGRLIACDGSGLLIAIDSATGAVLGEDATGLQAGSALAVLTWNDQLFFFTQNQGVISSYDLVTRQLTALGVAGDTIVGASAVPCVP
jgi:hypothetical protein